MIRISTRASRKGLYQIMQTPLRGLNKDPHNHSVEKKCNALSRDASSTLTASTFLGASSSLWYPCAQKKKAFTWSKGGAPSAFHRRAAACSCAGVQPRRNLILTYFRRTYKNAGKNINVPNHVFQNTSWTQHAPTSRNLSPQLNSTKQVNALSFQMGCTL